MDITDGHPRKQRGQAMATTSSNLSAAVNGLATQTPPNATFEELEDKPLSVKEWQQRFTFDYGGNSILHGWCRFWIVRKIL